MQEVDHRFKNWHKSSRRWRVTQADISSLLLVSLLVTLSGKDIIFSNVYGYFKFHLGIVVKNFSRFRMNLIGGNQLFFDRFICEFSKEY